MPMKIIITKDFDEMSEVASKIVVDDIKQFQKTKQKKDSYVLGLATGNTPTGLYKHLAKAANSNEFNPETITSFNLDEYIGLPGDTPSERVLHPESYAFFMIQELFGLLNKKFRKTHVPAGTEIDLKKLLVELDKYKNNPNVYEFLGNDAGKQIFIKPNSPSDYLNYIKKEILDAYIDKIKKFGGIDLHIVGVGGRGHLAFHERGIPLDQEALLVKLDENTIGNAVIDGHFKEETFAPKYAISLGSKAVFRAKTVLLLANGKRKAESIAASLLGEVTDKVPISMAQEYAKNGGNMIYVLEKEAAAGLTGKFDELKSKGFEVLNTL